MQSNAVNESVPVDFFQSLKIIWTNKLLIVSLTFLTSIFSVFFALSLPNYYTSSALLVPKDGGDSSSSMLGQYSGLASMAGIDIGGEKENKTDLAIATLKSRHFVELISGSIENFAQILVASKSYDENTESIVFDPEIYDMRTKKWVRNVKHPLTPEPSILELHTIFNTEVLSTNVDQKTGFINIGIELISPIDAKYFLETIIEKLNEISRKNAVVEAEKSLYFLNSELSKVSTLSLKNSLDKLVDVELNKKMMAEVNKDYLLKIIDPPFIPERKSRPQRAIICIIGFLFGLVTSIGLAFLKEIISKIRQKSVY